MQSCLLTEECELHFDKSLRRIIRLTTHVGLRLKFHLYRDLLRQN